jgi:hypothetical protein
MSPKTTVMIIYAPYQWRGKALEMIFGERE